MLDQFVDIEIKIFYKSESSRRGREKGRGRHIFAHSILKAATEFANNNNDTLSLFFLMHMTRFNFFTFIMLCCIN